MSTQPAHICFLLDDFRKAYPTCFGLYKARIIIRPAKVGEVIAFSSLEDVPISLFAKRTTFLFFLVKVQLLRERKGLFDVISKTSRTSENRMI